MVKKIKKLFKKIGLKRHTVLILVFCILFAILLQRLFSLQIIHGKEYAENFNLSITKERTLKETRGTIFDRNGKPLAYNKLSYSIILEDNGTYETTRERNLSLNHLAYEVLNILKQYNETLNIDFHIVLDENDTYIFDTTGFNLNRFKADVYGQANIEKLKKEELNATPDKIIEDLSNEKRFGLVNKKNPYTKEELDKYELPETFTKEETLDILKIRYALSNNSFKKYVPVTLATNISEETVAEIMERKDELQGIDVEEDSVRIYDEAEAFAPIIGYTGKADADELEKLREDGHKYSADAVIGKAGIEKIMEPQLRGTDGSDKVLVDTMGKVLEVVKNSRKEPKSGNNVYLTLDKDLQRICYDVLEQKIAGILVANIINAKEFDIHEGMDTAAIKTPIYDVYNALIDNSVLDINHFKDDDATELEKTVYSVFQQQQQNVFQQIQEELTKETPIAYKDLSKEMQEYQSYIVNEFLTQKKEILSMDAIDSSDPTYIAWAKDETISLKEFLTYSAGKDWIDISQFSAEGEYLDSSQIYTALADYLTQTLSDDIGFSKIIYKYMLHSDLISGTQICMLLYDQGILENDEVTYNALKSGSMTAYDFMIEKISNLEITPAQLALDPCSGSVVITDVQTGETLACVTYPGYDNNRLANNMDTEYFAKLSQDLSRPFYNKATQQLTAPGSTFKIVTAVAGMEEGIVDDNYGVVCNGRFDKIPNGPYCWLRTGHGHMNVVSGITNSCNVFMGQVAYDLGTDNNGRFSDSLGIDKLQKYANMFLLNEKSGLEITEASPEVSEEDAIRTSFGQAKNNITTSQLARYVTTIASRGTNYELTLFDKVTDADGNLVEDYQPTVKGEMDVANSTWDIVHEGMRGVAKKNTQLNSMKLSVAGKTGTAQEDMSRPSHGLFIGFAPYENPEVGMAVRIGNGYSSNNAVSVAKDILNYKYNFADESEIVIGKATADDTTTTHND